MLGDGSKRIPTITPGVRRMCYSLTETWIPLYIPFKMFLFLLLFLSSVYRTVNQVRKFSSVDNFDSSLFCVIFFSCSAPSTFITLTVRFTHQGSFYGLSRHATLINSITEPLNFPNLKLVFVGGGFLRASKRPAEVEWKQPAKPKEVWNGK